MLQIEPAIEEKLIAVDVVEQLDPHTFLRNYIQKNRPVKMTGMMDEWPAMKKWSFDFFRQLGSDASVLLEEGNVMQDDTGFRNETFSDFIEKLLSDDVDVQQAYLSVFRIFDQFPDLRADVDFSILDQHKIKSSTSGWIGPAGTVTGYHIDWGDNILAQVCGRKCIHLASPDQSANMYPGKKFDQGTTISEVNMDEYDESKHPRFAQVQHERVILNPGEMIFIPRGWWHHVRSLDRSISVSNIAYDVRSIVTDLVPHRLKQILHDAGLWKCDCTCHVIRDGKWVRK